MKSYPTLVEKRLKAYTITEILVVLVIIGILVLLALPNLLPPPVQVYTLEQAGYYIGGFNDTMIRVVCYLPAGHGKFNAVSLYADSRAGLGVIKSVVVEVIFNARQARVPEER